MSYIGPTIRPTIRLRPANPITGGSRLNSLTGGATARLANSSPKLSGICFQPGDIFADRFVIHGRLGAGGYGTVYKAYDRERGIDLALKIAMEQQGVFDDAMLAETTALQKLTPHPHLVGFHEAGVHNAIRYLALAHIEGRTLKDRIYGDGPMTLPEAIDIISQICVGLQQVVADGLLHKDIKPQNVMLRDDGSAVLIDFGLSCYVNAPGTFMGTPVYASPEALLADKLDIRSDIYSLGIMFLEMLSGNTGLHDSGHDDVCKLFQQKQVGPVIIDGALHPSAKQLIQEMTASKAEDRPQTYDDLLNRLQTLKAEFIEISQQLAGFQQTLPGDTRKTPQATTVKGEVVNPFGLTFAAPQTPINIDPGPTLASPAPTIKKDISPPFPTIDLKTLAVAPPSISIGRKVLGFLPTIGPLPNTKPPVEN